MKKSLIALAVLAAAAGTASAQSSVTVFGIVDVNVRQLDNGGVKQSQVSTDGANSSRLGFRGVEDLGGGLKAGFWLESALAADTGNINSSGKFWHRRATVSLSDDRLGEIRLGRDLTPTWNAFADFDVFGTNGVGDATTTYAALGGIDTRIRADNLVSYFLPTLGGFYGQLSVAPGEGVAGKKYVGGRLGYRSGPIDVNAAYGQTEVTTDDVKLAVISGSYDFGVVKLLASAQQAEYQDAKDRHYTIGASVPFGASLVRASYSKADGSGSLATRDADQFAIGYVYNLSKRTAVYTTYAEIKNKGSANYTVASISGVTLPKTEETSQGFELGLRHAF